MFPELFTTKITLEISQGGHKATIVASYRFWTKDPDPWVNLSLSVYLVSGGTWSLSGTDAVFFAELLNPLTGVTTNSEVFRLFGIVSAAGNPFKVGQSGSGFNKHAGSVIPVGPIFWKVLAVV